MATARAEVPPAAFSMPLEGLGLKEHVFNILTEAGYETIGDLMLALKLDENKVLGPGRRGSQGHPEHPGTDRRDRIPRGSGRGCCRGRDRGRCRGAAGATAELQPEPTAVAERAPAEAVEALAVEAVPGADQPEKAHAARGKEGEEEVEPENAKDGVSLDELFKMKPEIFHSTTTEEEEAEKKKGKKQKKKGVELVLDEDLGAVVGRKKHKRGEGEFGEEE